MQVGTGEHSYEWTENWAEMPHPDRARTGWAHPGMTVSQADDIYTFHPSDPTVLVFNPQGILLRTIDTDLTEGHGIAWSLENGVEYLWIADTGSKRRPATAYQAQSEPPRGQVVKLSLDGTVVQKLDRPSLADPEHDRYSPTSVALLGGLSGDGDDVWVADGYGQSRVHHYRLPGGEHLGSIDGEEGAGRFACPHGIWIDSRKSEPELYVADRSNHRVQVFDLSGKFKRAFGSTFLSSPSGFARSGDFLIVAELRARLAVLDPDDNLVCYLGSNEEVCQADGWPNAKSADGAPTRSDRLAEGKFNSPHGIAVDSDGSIYVSEWLIGGRTVKLRPTRRSAPTVTPDAVRTVDTS